MSKTDHIDSEVMDYRIPLALVDAIFVVMWMMVFLTLVIISIWEGNIGGAVLALLFLSVGGYAVYLRVYRVILHSTGITVHYTFRGKQELKWNQIYKVSIQGRGLKVCNVRYGNWPHQFVGILLGFIRPNRTEVQNLIQRIIDEAELTPVRAAPIPYRGGTVYRREIHGN